MGFFDFLGGAADVFSDVGNTVLGFMNYDYNKRMQERAWEREDNAVQRRMADLKKAGLNPLLAVGSAAQASSPMRLEAPQIQDAVGTKLQRDMARMEMLRGQEELGKVRADRALVEAQRRRLDTETDFMGRMNPLREEEQILENAYRRASDPLRVRQLAAAVSSGEFDVSLQELERQMRQIGLDRATIQKTQDEIGRDLAEFDLSEVDKRRAASAIALETARMARDEYKRSIGIWKEAGLPTEGATGSAFERMTGGILNSLRDLFRKR